MKRHHQLRKEHLMDMLPEIVAAIEQKLAQSPLESFYEKRKALKGGHQWSGPLLQIQRDIDGPYSGYAYHKGGRGELQFNVGFEEEGRYFRYGVAFSFEPDRNLPDPIEVLEPKVKCFNRVLTEFPEIARLRLWLHENGQIGRDLDLSPIPKSWVERDNFVFIGERVRVPRSGITRRTVARAAEVLVMLWPLYQRIEAVHSVGMDTHDYKVARLCWNTNLWQSPSGWDGKSKNKDAFEAENGFGHEEWLFNKSMLIDGMKYGFVQALNHDDSKYEGKRINLLFYTIDSRTKLRYWVGAIDAAEVLSAKERRLATREMHRNGWTSIMRKQVRTLGLSPESLTLANSLTNIRFHPDQLRVFDPVPFPANELPGGYYGTLQDVPREQKEIVEEGQSKEDLIERNLRATKAVRHTYEATTEVDLVQARWQKELRKTLPQDLPTGTKVDIEAVIDGHQVDAVITHGEKRIFIEIKTQGSIRQVIRSALSQLMEYAYWPNKRRCHALLIVGATPGGGNELAYLKMLRERFQVPVYYLPYSNGRIVDIATWLTSLPIFSGQ